MRSFLLILAGVANVLGFPVAPRHVVHERRDVLPEYWIEESRLDKQERLPVRIGLAQSNLDHGHDLLMEMYVSCDMGQDITDDSVPTRLPHGMGNTSLQKRCTVYLLRQKTALNRSELG
jgi:hypothetical protein